MEIQYIARLIILVIILCYSSLEITEYKSCCSKFQVVTTCVVIEGSKLALRQPANPLTTQSEANRLFAFLAYKRFIPKIMR